MATLLPWQLGFFWQCWRKDDLFPTSGEVGGKCVGFFRKKLTGHNTQYNVRKGVDALASKIDILDTVLYIIYLYIHVIITAYLDLFRYLSSPHYICPHLKIWRKWYMEWKFGAFHTQKNLIQGSLLFTSMIGVSNNESLQNLAQKTPHQTPKKGGSNKNADMTWGRPENLSKLIFHGNLRSPQQPWSLNSRLEIRPTFFGETVA